MQNEHALSRQSCIPFHRLTVLQEEILVTVPIIINNVCVTTIHQGSHAADTLCRGEFYGVEPSSHPSFIAGIACRQIAVAIIGTAVHQIPPKHSYPIAFITGVVEVGETQAMTELMAHGSDAADVTTTIQF